MTKANVWNFVIVATLALLVFIIPLWLGFVANILFGMAYFYGFEAAIPYAQASLFNPFTAFMYNNWLFDYWWPNKTHPSFTSLAFLASFPGPVIAGFLGSAVLLFLTRAPIMDFRPFKGDESLHGDARWASEADIKSAGLRSKKGMLLGRTGKNDYLVADDYQHALLFAPTGSGKGVGFVLPNLLYWEESVLCHDIKLENHMVTSGWRESIGHEVYVWNPADPNGNSHCYNPLDWISEKPGQMVDDTQKICNLLMDQQEFWENEARSLLMGVILYLCAVPEKLTSFGEVVRTMRSDDVVYSLAVVLDTIGKKIHPVSYMNIASFLQKADKERSGVVSTMNSKLELWANPLIDTTTATSDFNLMDLKKKKMTVYCGVTPDNLQRLAPLLKVFYQQAADFMTRNMPTKEEKYGVLFLMDEFPTLGEMEMFKSGIAYFRGYHVKLFLICQDTQQLKGIYEEAGMNSFLSNSFYRITFAANNIETANMISQLVGNKTVKQVSHNKPKFFDLNPSSRTTNTSEAQRALLLPQEVITLPRDEQILLIESSPPIKTKKIFYFEDPMFLKRAWGQGMYDNMKGPTPTVLPQQEAYDPRKKAMGRISPAKLRYDRERYTAALAEAKAAGEPAPPMPMMLQTYEKQKAAAAATGDSGDTSGGGQPPAPAA